eukprot:359247-Chlamydomonas_euryale.AAC.7
MALPQGRDDVVLDPLTDHGPSPAARTLHLCIRSCILQGTLRGGWVNAWMRMVWPARQPTRVEALWDA